MDDAHTVQGGCFCGFVRYEAQGPFCNETCCHCSMCRRISAAPLVAWVTVPRAQLRFVAGLPTSFRSSDHASRSFCPRCGTPLTFADDAFPDEIDVTTCSLTQPEALPPRDHTRTSTRLSWVKLSDGLPNFAESRGGPSSDQ